MASRGEKDGYFWFAILGYIFAVKSDRISTPNQKRMIGCDMTAGALALLKGGYPDWSMKQGPFVDENKLSAEELEYVW